MRLYKAKKKKKLAWWGGTAVTQPSFTLGYLVGMLIEHQRLSSFFIVLSDKNFHNSELKDTREMKIICMAHYFIKFS
jgi:hypothetical protein